MVYIELVVWTLCLLPIIYLYVKHSDHYVEALLTFTFLNIMFTLVSVFVLSFYYSSHPDLQFNPVFFIFRWAYSFIAYSISLIEIKRYVKEEK